MARKRTIEVHITGDASGAKAELTGLGQIFDKIKARFTQLLGVAGLFAIIRGLKNAGEAAVRMAIDFEASMAKIEGLVGESSDQVAVWSEQLKDLAHETGKPLNELADGLYFVASAGLETSQVMDVMEVSAKASAAGLGQTSTIADAATSAMNAYRDSNLTAGEAVNVLIGAVREGKAEPEELASSIGRVIPIASELGVSFDQVGAAIGSMSLLGLDAAESTTALRGILSALIKPTHEGAVELERLGLSYGQLRQQVREQGLLPTLLDLSEAFGDNEESASKVFGNVRALTGVLNLVGDNAEQVEQVFANMTDTSGLLDEAFDTVSETAGFKLNRTMSDLKTMGVEVGSELLPRIAEAFEALLPVLDELLPALGEIAESIIMIARDVIPVLLPAVETFADVLSGLNYIVLKFSSGMSESARHEAAFIEAQESLNQAMARGKDPVTSVANALAHLVVNGALTEERFTALTRQAMLTGDEIYLVKEALYGYVDSGRAASDASAAYQDQLAELERQGRKNIEIEEIEANTLDDLAAAFGTTEGRVGALLSAGSGVPPSFDEIKQAANKAEPAIAEYGSEVQTLQHRLADAKQAQENLSDVLLAAADPAFNAINAYNNYVDSLARYEEATKDPEVSTQELARLQIEVAENALKAQSAISEFDGTTMTDGVDAIAKALGTTREEVEGLFNEIGILEGKKPVVVVSVEAPVIKWTQSGNTAIPDKSGTRRFFRHGGIVTDPLVGVIGEAGDDEAIIPLNRRGVSFMARALAEAGLLNGIGGGQGGGRPIQVNLVLDGKVLASVLVNDMADALRRREESLS